MSSPDGPALGNPFAGGDHWKGTYTCPQGLTQLDLQIISVSGDDIPEAIFSFDWTTGGVSGAFYMSGTFDPNTWNATLTPGAWITQPSGWFTVGMEGTVDSSTMTYAGNITASGCGTFSVARQTPTDAGGD